jgi:competence protein ComEA
VPALSRSQLLLYGALAVALLLLGARWIRSGDAREASSGDGESSSYAQSGAASDPGGSSDTFAAGPGGEDVVVHVAGAVRDSGVYRLPAGSRVTDAIERAGGPAASADIDAINLAARLADGQQVVVPARAKSPVVAGGAAGPSAGGGSTGSSPEAPISLGTATIEQLDTIEGIGPVTAQDILDFRDAHGGISDIEELDQVSGIGPATMEALRTRLQP